MSLSSDDRRKINSLPKEELLSWMEAVADNEKVHETEVVEHSSLTEDLHDAKEANCQREMELVIAIADKLARKGCDPTARSSN